MHNEVEIKLEVTTSDADVITASDILTKKPRCLHLRSIYYDTPTLGLSQAGLTLRVRQSDGEYIQTVKATGAGAGYFARPEWETPVVDDRPILDDASPLRAILANGVSELAPIFEVRVERLVWDVDCDASRIEAALDRGEVRSGDRTSAICEMELELKSGHPDALFTLARRVDALVPLRIGVLNKAGRGFRLIGPIRRDWKSEPVLLSNGDTLRDAFGLIAASCMRQFRLNEPLIDRAHPEALHQCRVALRRLRSAFSVFKRAFKDPEFERLALELKWLANSLGPGRDLAVIATMGTLDDPERERLSAKLDAEYQKIRIELDSPRARSVMLDLCAWLASASPDALDNGNVPEASITTLATETLNRYRRKVKNGGEGLADLPDDARHQLRKDAKKLRYAADFFRSLYTRQGDKKAGRFIDVLAALQDQLGRLNDLSAAPEALEAVGLADIAERLRGNETRHRKWRREAAEAYAALFKTAPFWK